MKLFGSRSMSLLLCVVAGLAVFGAAYTMLGEVREPGSEELQLENNELGPVGALSKLFYVITGGDTEALKQILAEGADPNMTDNQGTTALAWSILGSDISPKVYGQVQALLAAGANPNLVDSDGMTPLHAAALHADEGVMTALLHGGGDAHIPDNMGNTPYEVALKWGNLGAVAAIEAASSFRHPDRETLMLWGVYAHRVRAFFKKNLPAGPERDEGIRKVNNFLVKVGLLGPEDKADFDAQSIADVNRVSRNQRKKGGVTK